MDDASRRAIEWECAQVLTRFINALDSGDYETMASLMAPDGVWNRPSGDTVGPDGLLEALKDRPRDLIIRHVISNIVIDVVDENRADGITYLTVYRHDGSALVKDIAPLKGPHMVGVSYNRLVRKSDGWRILEKRTRRTFVATSMD